MDGTNDGDKPTTPSGGDDFDAQAAARMLAQTKRDANRQFTLGPPWYTVSMGAVILIGYGALWLSVRGQHPYTGPSLLTIGLVYAVVIASIAVGATVHRRTTAGIAGPSVLLNQLEGIAMLVSFLGSPVLQGALKHYGASNAIVYGVIPAAGPLIVVGTTALGIAASKANWPQFGAALVAVAGGVVAAFTGPIDAWLTAGIAMFAAVAVYAVTTGKLLNRG